MVKGKGAGVCRGTADLEHSVSIAYTIGMDLTWDTAKAASNLAKHGVAFEAAEAMDWETVLIRATRNPGGQPWLLALGGIDGRLHAMVFTMDERTIRIISLRKANSREIAHYASS
jgi:uncharacterized DUF497 family protein